MSKEKENTVDEVNAELIKSGLRGAKRAANESINALKESIPDEMLETEIIDVDMELECDLTSKEEIAKGLYDKLKSLCHSVNYVKRKAVIQAKALHDAKETLHKYKVAYEQELEENNKLSKRNQSLNELIEELYRTKPKTTLSDEKKHACVNQHCRECNEYIIARGRAIQVSNNDVLLREIREQMRVLLAETYDAQPASSSSYNEDSGYTDGYRGRSRPYRRAASRARGYRGGRW